MTRILYLITKSELGGAQTHVFQLCREMSERGHVVAVMAEPGGWLQDRVEELGAVFFPNCHFANDYNPLRGIRAAHQITVAVRTFKPDVISVHSSFAGFWTRVATRNRTPTIFTAHGWGFTPGAPRLRRIVTWLAEKMAAPFCDRIVCVSEFDKQLALRFMITRQNQLAVIHNAAEPTGIREELAGLEPSGDSSTYAATLKKKSVRIVFVGRLSTQKLPEMLISAFAKLDFRVKAKAHVVIVGDGEKACDLKAQAQEFGVENQIRFLGAQPRSEVLSVLKNADIFVLTSAWEGFPISILEAMSVGLPVIASNVGGVREVFEASGGRRIGVLLENNSELELHRALEGLIMEDSRRREMGRNAKNVVEETFSLDAMCDKYVELYQEILERHHGGGVAVAGR